MKTTNIGMPNVHDALIKKAVEGYWRGTRSLDDIKDAEERVCAFNASAQSLLDLRPVGDIDIYDRVLRTATYFGIVPRRFGLRAQPSKSLAAYLQIPRGTDTAAASPMVKWFNTNYHVVQPEIEEKPARAIRPRLPELADPRDKIALIGPWTLVSYAINKTCLRKNALYRSLSQEYVKLINSLPPTTIQLEEPCFVTHGMPKGYDLFLGQLRRPVHLHTYFGAVTPIDALFELPVQGIGLDFVDGEENLAAVRRFPKDKLLIAGVISGRNVWPASVRTQETLERILEHVPHERLYISPSCSLMHVPLSAREEGKDNMFSFALEKLAELEAIKNGSIEYKDVKKRPTALPERRYERSRKHCWLSTTPYPTTTIGSFPQTGIVRRLRREWKKGTLPTLLYEANMKGHIRFCIRAQERLGLDVLVHGEFERPDMVQYFAEQLEGFTLIRGRVQSYGTRHVRPPVITGPVRRPHPMTVKWIEYAQQVADERSGRPVKGILTGPVTMVQWSYPREDIPREAQFYDVAQALAEEVDDLVKAGVRHVQIDEPALREGLPLDKRQQHAYLWHAVNAFRRTYAAVPDSTIIHSHMCFSEFNDILEAIKDMGVDVLSIEDSKAKGKVAASLKKSGFPASIGLGVYDVHSPRIPTVKEMAAIPASLHMDPRRIWINPDCGLKTRGEKDARQQLEKMMEAARALRGRLTGAGTP